MTCNTMEKFEDGRRGTETKMRCWTDLQFIVSKKTETQFYNHKLLTTSTYFPENLRKGHIYECFVFTTILTFRTVMTINTMER